MSEEKVLPPEVVAALDALRATAERHGLSMVDILPVSPNQACMWKMSGECHRLRRLLDGLAPGWNDEI